MLTETTETISPDLFRAALSHWASGVTVVTTRDAAGQNHGFTASAFSSVSLDPALVLVCLDNRANCFDAFDSSEGFVVHLLARDQQELAGRFASKGADKFAGSGVTLSPAGQPLLPGALARLECRTERRVPGGDHLILIGEVHQASEREGEPLVYFQRRFHDLTPAG
ncbi:MULTISPECIES: flavin reductase family protein [Streptomyces]|uniref:Flavin reductase family protein n=2 Tax=Streptomyces TaxID=1883 RepID=A0A939FKX1_9ACTN|nr:MULTISPECIES: flavin reductase family protein [Streptomyces]MBO0652611.1 flavin reductase family protein [Streptomyces triculaminicus]QSY51805.1 flavin reductase family protein [Streptomyces griseocarneus]